MAHASEVSEFPAWIPCPEECDDFYCTIHEMHTADCECPEIDDWVERGIDPCSEGGKEIL